MKNIARKSSLKIKKSAEKSDLASFVASLRNGDYKSRLKAGQVAANDRALVNELNLLARKLATDSRARSEGLAKVAIFDGVIKNNPGMVYQFRLAADGKMFFDFVSSMSNEIFGLTPEEMAANPEIWIAQVHSADREGLLRDIQLSAQSMTAFEWRGRIMPGTGETKWILARSFPTKLSDGSILWNGILIDLTKETLAENEVKRVSKFLDSVLNNVPLMIFVKDCKKDFRLTLLNREGERILGVKSEEFLGKADADFFGQDFVNLFRDEEQEILRLRQPTKPRLNRLLTPNGERVFMTSKVPTFDEVGSPEYIIGIANDITDEISLQNDLELERSKAIQSAKLASLGEMSAGIAHEINNPLAIISGSIPLVRKDILNPVKLETRLEAMTKACARIEKIVGGLRKFARSSNKNVRSHEKVETIVAEALFIAESKAKRHQVGIELNVANDLYIKADSLEIEQVLINLFNNAIDAVKDLGERWVRVNGFADGEDVVLQILDSGRGISKEIEAKLFQPFFTTKPIGEGTGLGLSISKGILDQHGAELSLNREFANTCFEIRFPQSVADEAREQNAI